MPGDTKIIQGMPVTFRQALTVRNKPKSLWNEVILNYYFSKLKKGINLVITY